MNERLDRLKELEKIIEKDLGAWIRTGQAIIEIRDEKLYQETHPTLEAWAKGVFNISRARVYQLADAVKTRDHLSTMVDTAPTNERQARELTRLDPESQVLAWNAALELADGDDVTEKHVRSAVREMNRQGRNKKMAEISKGNQPLEGLGAFNVLLADPPWQYDANTVPPADQIENKYPTMPIEELCALPVEKLAQDDAVLFLWATAPLLPEALEVMKSWGFKYKTGAVWDKVKKGMGYWFRGRHEHLLVGVRGEPPRPSPRSLVDSVITAPRGGHSEKPVEVHELIDAYYPELPKVELFARAGERPGWTAWGNQAQGAA